MSLTQADRAVALASEAGHGRQSAPRIRAQDVVAAAYESGYDGAEWCRALSALATYFGAQASAMVKHHFRSGRRDVLHDVGLQADCVRTYIDSVSMDNPWLRDEAAYRYAGSVHRDLDLPDDKALERSEFYQRVLRPQGLRHWLCMVLENDQRSVTYLVMLRSGPQQPFDTKALQAAGELAPHIVRAFQIGREQHDTRRREHAYQGALDRLSFGVLFVDSELRVQADNARARALIAATREIGVRQAKLHARDRTTEARLREIAALAARGDGGMAAMLLGNIDGTDQLIVRICVLPARLSGDEPQLVLFLTEPQADICIDVRQLQTVFALTAAEARLAARLVRGETVERAAEAMGVSTQTARSYLKRVFLKTGVNRQVDLTRTVLPIALFEGVATATPAGGRA